MGKQNLHIKSSMFDKIVSVLGYQKMHNESC